ncbi:sirohydrochlorin chelatase [Pueribacillus theae]|nr:sirohydrochlorin chelatase [Pueribacillus theae]
MMKAVLYVAHGSRMKEAVQETSVFVKKMMKRVDVPIQTLCFIELAKPTIQEGIAQCIEEGATHIAVVPILLLKAGHAKRDIPQEIAKAKETFPHVSFSYGRPFGVHESMIDVLVERIKEQQTRILPESRVLLVGRGSSDPSVLADFYKIKERLSKKLNVASINVCYLAAAEPHLHEGLHQEIKSDAKQIFIVPYLLFTGLLMKSLEEKIKSIESRNQTFILCKHMGYHEKIAGLFLNRVQEALNEGNKGMLQLKGRNRSYS